MVRLGRILAVTLGLSVVGAAFGAIAGAVALALSLALTGSSDVFRGELLQVFVIPAIIGAIFGAVGAPAAGWLFLRQVPLGKVFMWTAIGTAIGGVAGWILGVALRATVHGPSPLFGDEVNSGIWGAIGGFAVAVTMLRRRASTENNSAMELQPPPS